MTIHAETERFYLRDIDEGDLEGMFEMDSDPEVHRYLGNQPVTDREFIRFVINNIRKQYDTLGIGRWAIAHKDTNEFMGWAGLKLEKGMNGREEFYDLGYRLPRKHWGKGIATEVSKASVRHAFEVMGLPEIFGVTDARHTASGAVLLKSGLRFVNTFNYEELPHHWYEMTAEMYRTRVS